MYQFITYLVPVFAAVSLIIGIAAMIAPAKMSRVFGIAVDGKAAALVVGMGVRDIFIGGIILILYFMDLLIPIGWSLLLLGLISLSDFWCVRKYGSKPISWTHLTSAVVVTGVGVYLVSIP